MTSDRRDECVVAIDAGTTGVRSRAVFADGRPAVAAYQEFTQYFPEPGWVEHDATEIWNAAAETLRQVVTEVGRDQVAAIGITNQRETVLAWNRSTGTPYGTAIVWQDRRTAQRCDELTAAGHLPLVRERTGLVLDPYFSGTKIEWLLGNRGIPLDDDLAERVGRGLPDFAGVMLHPAGSGKVLGELTVGSHRRTAVDEHRTAANASRAGIERDDAGLFCHRLRLDVDFGR